MAFPQTQTALALSLIARDSVDCSTSTTEKRLERFDRLLVPDGRRKPSAVYLAVIVAVVKVMFPAPPPPTSTRILASSIFPSVRPKLAHSL